MINKITLSDYQDFIRQTEGLDELESELILYQIMVDKTAKKENISTKILTKRNSELLQEIEAAKKDLTVAFKMDDVEYGFIPDLENMTFGEVVDLDTYLKDPDLHHKAMAVLYRPIIKHEKGKYNILSYGGTDVFADIMKNMPFKYYLSAMDFFERLGIDLQNAIPSYLPQQKEKVAS